VGLGDLQSIRSFVGKATRKENMNILATINFGKKKQVTAPWKFFETQQLPYLVIAEDQNKGHFVIPLEKGLVHDSANLEIAEKLYTGTVNASDGQFMKLPD
jgi:hypothetical protein